MKKLLVWKKIGIFLLCVIVIYFSWNYFYQKDSIDSSITNPQSIQEKTKAEICFQEVSQNECYGTCSVVECPDEICPKKIQQSYCICIGGIYDGNICLIKGEKYLGISFENFRNRFYWGGYKEGTPENWVHAGKGTKSEGWFLSRE